MNKVFLIGNLTRDPELTTTGSGIQLCRFGIAVNRNYSNSEGVRETDFFNITAWRNNAEKCGKYLHKGNKVAIAGNIQMRSYETNGEKRTGFDIVVDEVEFLSPKGSDGSFTAPSADSDAEAPKHDSKVAELEPIDDTDLPF